MEVLVASPSLPLQVAEGQAQLRGCLDEHRDAVGRLIERMETLKAHCTSTEMANTRLRWRPAFFAPIETGAHL